MENAQNDETIVSTIYMKTNFPKKNSENCNVNIPLPKIIRQYILHAWCFRT